MSTELEQQVQAPPQSSSQPTTTTPSVDADELAALRERAELLQGVVDRLDPHAETIKWILENDDAEGLIKGARSAYDRMREEQGPQVTPELKPIYEKVSRLERLADDYEKQQKEAAERPAREWNDKWQAWQNDSSNDRFYRKLRQDYPDLGQAEYGWLAQKAADANFAPLEQVFNENRWRFVQERPSPPPPSSRASAGDVGIPGSSTTDGATDKSMRERVIELEKIRQGRGAA